jgi:hypothetical protein
MNQATIAPSITTSIPTCRPARPARTSLATRLGAVLQSRRDRDLDATGDAPARADTHHASPYEALRDRQAEVTLTSLRA